MDQVSREELLNQIQLVDFYAVELNLFLNTHPNDPQALRDYQYILEQSAQLRKMYVERFGPLMNFQHGSVTNNHWSWIRDPWPWENQEEGSYVDL